MIIENTASPWPADRVQRRPIADLVPYARNARAHSDAQIAQIAASMREWGWTNPVLVDEQGSIIAGHGRVLAARQLGYGEVPVMVADGWSEAQKRAYTIADNKLALNADWDTDLLKVELADLAALDFDIDLIGFSADELGPLLANMGPGLTDPDDAPEPPANPVSELGNVWLLGRHRLLCGNSTLEDDVKRVVGVNVADMIFTDPPYGVAYHGSSTTTSIAGDITQAAIPISFKQAIDHATKDKARLYFCGGSSNVSMYFSLFDAFLRKAPSMIIWDKGHIILRRNNYHSQYEIIFFGWKGIGGDDRSWFGGRKAEDASDVWRVNRDSSRDYLHPTQKPVALATRAIKNSCPDGGIVYEPFSGSGSTIIAAEATNRCCYAIELDPAYVDVAARRWQSYTGKVATLEATGRTFAEVAAARGVAGSDSAEP